MLLAAPDLDRDRPLPERARAACGARAGRHARRHARRRSERRDRALGIYVLAPFDAQHVAAVPQHRSSGGSRSSRTAKTRSSRPSSPRSSSSRSWRSRSSSSICRELFLGVPRTLEEGAIGLGATRWEMVKTRHRPVVARRRRRGDHPRPRPCTRRGDRRHPGDRQLHPAHAVDLRARGHDREPGREPVPGRGQRTSRSRRSIYLALILLVITFVTNLARAAHRQAVRVPANGARLTDRAAISLAGERPRPAAARRQRARRGVGGRRRSCSRSLVLAIVVWSVGSRAVGALNVDFFTKGPADSSARRRAGSRPRSSARCMLVARRDARSRCRSAC